MIISEIYRNGKSIVCIYLRGKIVWRRSDIVIGDHDSIKMSSVRNIRTSCQVRMMSDAELLSSLGISSTITTTALNTVTTMQLHSGSDSSTDSMSYIGEAESVHVYHNSDIRSAKDINISVYESTDIAHHNDEGTYSDLSAIVASAAVSSHENNSKVEGEISSLVANAAISSHKIDKKTLGKFSAIVASAILAAHRIDKKTTGKVDTLVANAAISSHKIDKKTLGKFSALIANTALASHEVDKKTTGKASAIVAGTMYTGHRNDSETDTKVGITAADSIYVQGRSTHHSAMKLANIFKAGIQVQNSISENRTTGIAGVHPLDAIDIPIDNRQKSGVSVHLSYAPMPSISTVDEINSEIVSDLLNNPSPLLNAHIIGRTNVGAELSAIPIASMFAKPKLSTAVQAIMINDTAMLSSKSKSRSGVTANLDKDDTHKWEYPVQTGNTLYITQVLSAIPDGTTLRIT